MPRKRYKTQQTQQIIGLLRQVEVQVANGRLTPQPCREAMEITEVNAAPCSPCGGKKEWRLPAYLQPPRGTSWQKKFKGEI